MAVYNKGWVALCALVTGAVLLAGCETTPRQAPASTKTATRALTSGEFVLAAREFERLAETVQSPTKQHYQLRAVELYLRAGQVNEARKKIRQIGVTGLDPIYRARKRVLEGQLAASEGDYSRAIILLNAAKRASNLSPELMADIHWNRAQAQIALEKPMAAVGDLILRERYLVDEDAIEQNQMQLWKVVTSLPRAELRTRLQRIRSAVLRGWIELAVISIENRGKSLEPFIADWKQRHSSHPASSKLLATITNPKPTLVGKVDRVAVLLPLTSRHGRAAQAVKDGFLAMDRANADPDKPVIKVYDVGDNPASVVDYYRQAVRDGAQMVVGPLGVEAAGQLVRRSDFPVPTLLLSHTKGDVGSRNVFQFGLPPEQEARQAAERAYLDGHRQAAVLYPQNEWGERMRRAFVDYWQKLGGVLIHSQLYDPKAGDFSEPVRKMLNVTQSYERRLALQSILRRKIEFEPRARADIDFVFLAADARRGRLIKPQLNYYRAANTPVYATSHIYLGKVDAGRDTDLNGVMFGDMPWMLLGDKRMQALRATLQQNWPHAYSPYDRLFALGIDSYAVIPHLGRIATDESVRFNGVTSGLSVDRRGRLRRQLIWARFRHGVPRILDTFVKYREQLDLSDSREADKTPVARSKG